MRQLIISIFMVLSIVACSPQQANNAIGTAQAVPTTIAAAVTQASNIISVQPTAQTVAYKPLEGFQPLDKVTCSDGSYVQGSGSGILWYNDDGSVRGAAVLSGEATKPFYPSLALLAYAHDGIVYYQPISAVSLGCTIQVPTGDGSTFYSVKVKDVPVFFATSGVIYKVTCGSDPTTSPMPNYGTILFPSGNTCDAVNDVGRQLDVNNSGVSGCSYP